MGAYVYLFFMVIQKEPLWLNWVGSTLLTTHIEKKIHSEVDTFSILKQLNGRFCVVWIHTIV